MFDPMTTATSPPRKLGAPGMSLWNSIQIEFRIDDAAGRELLAQACAALDRVEALAERIDRDGELIETETGLKPHPALREERAGRSFVVRTLERLGLNLESVRPVGRPTTWRKRQEERQEDRGGH